MSSTIYESTPAIVENHPIVALERRERIINHFARVTQFLTWPILFIIFHTIFNISIKGRRNLRVVRSPFIIVANHSSFYDSFLFRIILGLWTRHLPLRFMAVTKFDWKFLNFLAAIGVVDFIYSLFGVFTIIPGRGIDKNLEVAIEIIRAGGNVVIYPEGGINKGDELAPFKKGAAVLQRQTGVTVVPVSFKNCGHWLRTKICINVGGPMSILPGRTIEEVTESFRIAISELRGRD